MPYADATELAGLIRAKQLSPVEVVKTHLDRIVPVNPKLRACSRITESTRHPRESGDPLRRLDPRLRGDDENEAIIHQQALSALVTLAAEQALATARTAFPKRTRPASRALKAPARS